MGLSSRNRPVRIFKLTALDRKHLEQERSSFERLFAGINRVLAIRKLTSEANEPQMSWFAAAL
jgi:hypothetical protein